MFVLGGGLGIAVGDEEGSKEEESLAQNPNNSFMQLGG